MAVSQAKLICLDFDQTIVNGHFHSAFSRKGTPPNSWEPGVQILKNGRFHNVITKKVIDCHKGAKLSAIEALLADPRTGPKNGAQMRDTIRLALNHGHKVAICSFTLYPEVIVPTLARIGLTTKEINQICITGGFPSDDNPDGTPHGKEEHIRVAMNHFKITNRANVLLADDTQRNLDIALENGATVHGIVNIPKDINPDPKYFAQIQNFISKNPNPKEKKFTARHIGLGIASAVPAILGFAFQGYNPFAAAAFGLATTGMLAAAGYITYKAYAFLSRKKFRARKPNQQQREKIQALQAELDMDNKKSHLPIRRDILRFSNTRQDDVAIKHSPRRNNLNIHRLR